MDRMCLGINIDHVATIRNARGGEHPSPLQIAKIAEKNNVDNITAHLREDRRHIKDKDIRNLLDELKIPLNFEMADTEEMVSFAIENLPYACCIVPEKREEITTEGGLNLIGNKSISQSILKLKKVGIYCSVFLDPDIKQIKLASELGVNAIEIHTGAYCDAKNNKIQDQLEKIKIAAKCAKSIGLEVHAGHGLNFTNVIEISKVREITEVNIGHFIIGEAISMGFEDAIKKMRSIIDKSRKV